MGAGKLWWFLMFQENNLQFKLIRPRASLGHFVEVSGNSSEKEERKTMKDQD